MATVTGWAQNNTVITGGWANPTYAYSDDSYNATAAPSKNGSVVTAYWNFGLSVPTGATINSVTVYACYFVSTTSSIATFKMAAYKDTTLRGSVYSDTSEPTSESVVSTSNVGTWTVSELNNNTEAGGFKVIITGARGNSSTAVTFYCDYVKVVVDYSLVTQKSLTANVGATGSMSRTTHTLTKKSLTANVSGTGSMSRSTIEAGYHIERKAGAGGTYAEIAVDDASPYQDNGSFSSGTTYYYRVRLYEGGAYSDYSNEVSVAYSSSSTTQKALTATIGITGSVVKKGKKVLAGTAKTTSTIIKDVSKALSTTVKATGNATKKAGKSLVANATATAVFTKGLLLYKALTATVSAVANELKTATFLRGVGSATITPVGALVKSIGKSVGNATITPEGVTNKGAYKATGGATITPTGSTTEQTVLSQSVGGATITPTGGLAKTIGKMVGNAIITPVGAIAKTISKTVGQATITPVGNAVKTVSKTVGQATMTAIGALSTLFIDGGEPPSEETTIKRLQNFLKSIKNND